MPSNGPGRHRGRRGRRIKASDRRWSVKQRRGRAGPSSPAAVRVCSVLRSAIPSERLTSGWQDRGDRRLTRTT
jgi:hypothetical protein